MFSLNINNDKVKFRDIKLQDLPLILEWYNKVDDFKFATGIDSPITIENIRKKYAEVSISCNEFFVGIYLNNENIMIGILKGSLKYNEADGLWISSIVIDTSYQNKGYGTSAINLLLNYLKIHNGLKNIYLAVVEENTFGRIFWKRQNFCELRKIENHLRLQNKDQNVIIMHKRI